jgi:hypothetical protein
VTFSKAIDATTFTVDDIVLTGPSGTIAVNAPIALGSNVWRFSFPNQSAEGDYHFRIGPNILDLDGQAMNQNLNGIPGEEADAYTGLFTIDRAPPTVASVTIAPGLISVRFLDSGGMDPATVTDRAHDTLVSSGGDGVFGDTNDSDLSCASQASPSIRRPTCNADDFAALSPTTSSAYPDSGIHDAAGTRLMAASTRCNADARCAYSVGHAALERRATTVVRRTDDTVATPTIDVNEPAE